MIVTLATRSSARFAVATLPENCQGPALQHLTTPRVTSWSMYPTLCKNDRLELGPADPLHVGDLVVFRRPFGLVCHRLVARHDDFLLTKGDAGSGDPEQIMIQDVLGVVTAVVRGSTRVETADLAGLVPPPSWACILDHLTVALQEKGRRIAGRFIRPLLRHPRTGGFLARQMARCATIEWIGTSPVQSLHDAVVSGPSNLPPAQKGLNPLLLEIRLGPIYLGVFHPDSKTLDIRPILAGTPVESALARTVADRRER